MKIQNVEVECVATMGFISPVFGTLKTGAKVPAKYGTVKPFIERGYLKLSAESSENLKAAVEAARPKAKASK